MKKQLRALVFLVFVATLFYILYHYDNKYHSGPPYGVNGTFIIADDNQNEVMFLIDDWKFYENELITSSKEAKKPATSLFIGQYPNFKLIADDVQCGSYKMDVDVQSKQTMSILIPEIFSEYQIYINQTRIAQRIGDIVQLHEGMNEIVIQVAKSDHYYSGLVYPMALGSSQALSTMQRVHDLLYGGFAILSFTIAIFALVLRRHEQNKLFYYFGMLSFYFGVYSLYPFLHDFGSMKILYAVEDGSFMMVILYLALLCTSMANLSNRFYKSIRMIGGCMVVFSVFVPSFILPNAQTYIAYYGWIVDIYKVSVSLYLFYCINIMFKKQDSYRTAVALCGGVFALALLCNLVFNNLYEPIYTAWQSEYAMFFIILLFFFIINRKFAQTLDEHRRLSNELEEEVSSRTMDLQILLEERKAFFLDVAHDLKAPLSAIHNYTQLIEENNLYVDRETNQYIQSIERKNNEMIQRVNVFNQITKVDKINSVKQDLSINDVIQRVYEDNVPESDAVGIYFTITKFDHDVKVFGVLEKLLIVFENLFYNSLAFMPNKGKIQLYGSVQGKEITLCFEDSGEGIAEEHLPFVFDRFYSARKKQNEESGLGLYIVKMIISEMSGKVWIESKVGVGTKIYIKFPIKS